MIFFYFAENSTNRFIVCGYCVFFLNNSCVLSTESLIDNERLIKKKFKYNLLLLLNN